MRALALTLLTMLGVWSRSSSWQDGVVQVSANGRSPGSGFVAAVRSGRAYIVTCAQVVEGDPRPAVAFFAAPQERYAGEVRDLQGGRHDGLALLVVANPPPSVRVLAAGATREAPVELAGFSLGAFTSFSAKIASVKGTDLFLDRDVPEGLSGGPLVQAGRVVGMVYGRTGGFSAAVRASIIDAYLEGLDVAWGSGPKAEEPKVEPMLPSGLAAGTARVNPKDGLKYVWIPPGKFMMGCSPGDTECGVPEESPHQVTVSGFWMGQTEVAQAAYERVTGSNPSRFKGAQLPVDSLTWHEAGEYCAKVGMRLPMEAEWEYAARAGNPNARYGDLDSIAWYKGNSGVRERLYHPQSQEVGHKQPNAWELYDMLGNEWEWVADVVVGRANEAVLRGGSWNDPPSRVRVSNRDTIAPSIRLVDAGFRCAGETP